MKALLQAPRAGILRPLFALPHLFLLGTIFVIRFGSLTWHVTDSIRIYIALPIPGPVTLAAAAMWLAAVIIALVTSRVPARVLPLADGYVRWQRRVWAYILLVEHTYPTFGLASGSDEPAAAEPSRMSALGRILLLPLVVGLGFTISMLTLPTLLAASIWSIVRGRAPEWVVRFHCWSLNLGAGLARYLFFLESRPRLPSLREEGDAPRSPQSVRIA